MKVILSILIVIFVVIVFFISNRYIGIVSSQNEIHGEYEEINTKLEDLSKRLDTVVESIEQDKLAKKEVADQEQKEKEDQEQKAKKDKDEYKKSLEEKDKKISQLEKSIKSKTATPNRSGVSRRQSTLSLGTFSSTAYCKCTKCCGPNAKGITATGTKVQAGRTIAVDPKVIPLGSKVLINGKQYIAEDTGSAIKGNIVDIYFDSHSTALAWGRKNVEVQIVK